MHQIEREKKVIQVDFSGNANDGCYRNDASILFFAANSYKDAFSVLSQELERRFEADCRVKDIEHLILPYYFNFRHYVELELKALIVMLSGDSPKLSHKLGELVENFSNLVDEVKHDPTDRFHTVEEFEKDRKVVKDLIYNLKKRIHQYMSLEYADEYYRYIFEQEKHALALKNDTIELDYINTNKLFYDILKLFVDIRLALRSIVYIYFNL